MLSSSSSTTITSGRVSGEWVGGVDAALPCGRESHWKEKSLRSSWENLASRPSLLWTSWLSRVALRGLLVGADGDYRMSEH